MHVKELSLNSPRCALLCCVVSTILISWSLGLAACQQAPPSSSGSASSLRDDQIELMLAALSEAPSHGFRPGAFGEVGLADRLKTGGAAREQLRSAVLAYAAAMHGHAIQKAKFDRKWGISPPEFDAEAEFTKAATEGRLEGWLKALPPTTAQYKALRDGYAAYQKIQSDGGWIALSAHGDLKLGASGPQVAALRQRLAIDDPVAAEAGQADRFDIRLAQAVQRAQRRYGLHPTGVLDAETRVALNVPVEARLAQIRANLERLRWLPRDILPDRVEVNTAAGLVDVYRGGEHVMHMLGASGKPGDESPILVSKIETVVLNPTWNVPDTIADEEILPKGVGYLQRMGFVQNPPGEGVKLTQKPSPQNALGRVKFLFPNRYAVYLHDTPARTAFLREQRSVSHGCVRLERALDLARLVLSSEPGWPPERVDQVLGGQETTEVKLTRPLPVTLMYLTAFPLGDTIAFRSDVYGWDAEVLRRLDAAAIGNA
jgi:murein L,D-transpeptidase YcbB/YkuD